jgi:hypothetical protein
MTSITEMAAVASAGGIARLEGSTIYTQTYDAENRLISVNVSGQSLPTLFVYDGDGNFIKQYKPDGSRTLYVGGIYEVEKNSSGVETGTKAYYPAAGARRDGSTLYYVVSTSSTRRLKDHASTKLSTSLGSASVLTDASGATVTGAETRYYPFGEARFTGQRLVAELGIYHYGARFYSKWGRFSARRWSPDPAEFFSFPGKCPIADFNRSVGPPTEYRVSCH